MEQFEVSIGIVLINYNGLQLTRDCIASIERSSFRSYMIVIIDNASPDGSGEQIEREFATKYSVIRSSKNLGTSGANNMGMRLVFESGCTHVLILNNDTILTPDALLGLAAGSVAADVVVPLIMHYPEVDRVWYAGGYFDFFGVARHRGMGMHADSVGNDPFYTEYAPTCCFLISKEAYEDVGEFDEEYFMYWEDVDYCIALGRAGKRILCDPSIVIFHKVSASSGGERSPLSHYYSTRNRLRGVDKRQLGVRAWSWMRISIAKSALLKSDLSAYSVRAWKDYKHGRMGYQEFD